MNPEIHRDAWNKMKVTSLKFVLHHAARKLPIKSAELTKHCLRSENRLFAKMWPTVTEKLSEIYGIQVHEIRDGKSTRFFLCTSKFPLATEIQLTIDQRLEMRLLYLILSYIFMKSGTVLEANLWAYLARLGIKAEPHDFFGDVPKLINETFIKQMYLRKQKIDMESGDGDQRIEYSWGQRADLEFKKMDILKSVAELMGKIPEFYSKQFAEARQMEDEEEDEDEEEEDVVEEDDDDDEDEPMEE